MSHEDDTARSEQRNGRRESRPAFPCYAADFAASPKFRRMSLEERGAYLTLLLDAWMDRGIELESVADRLGVDESVAARIMAGVVGRCFELRGGRLVNPRQERERALLEARSARLAKAGAKGGKAKATPRPGEGRLEPGLAGLEPGEARLEPGQALAKPSGKGRVGKGREGSLEGEPERELPPHTDDLPPPAPRAGPGCTLEQNLAEFEFATLRSEVLEAAREWSRERALAGRRAWGARQWRPALRRAITDPSGFVAAVATSLDQGYEGLASARAAPGAPPRKSAREQSDEAFYAAWDQYLSRPGPTSPQIQP